MGTEILTDYKYGIIMNYSVVLFCIFQNFCNNMHCFYTQKKRFVFLKGPLQEVPEPSFFSWSNNAQGNSSLCVAGLFSFLPPRGSSPALVSLLGELGDQSLWVSLSCGPLQVRCRSLPQIPSLLSSPMTGQALEKPVPRFLW